MQAGKLRDRITILRKTEGTQNASGEPAVTWEELGVFRAEVLTAPGRERDIAEQTRAEAIYSITMRKQPSVDFQRADAVVRGDWDGSSTPDLDVLSIEQIRAAGSSRVEALKLVCREYAE